MLYWAVQLRNQVINHNHNHIRSHSTLYHIIIASHRIASHHIHHISLIVDLDNTVKSPDKYGASAWSQECQCHSMPWPMPRKAPPSSDSTGQYGRYGIDKSHGARCSLLQHFEWSNLLSTNAYHTVSLTGKTHHDVSRLYWLSMLCGSTVLSRALLSLSLSLVIAIRWSNSLT